MTRKALVSISVSVALAVAFVPVADAHKLTKSAAKREAKKTGTSLAQDLGGTPAYQCTRRTRHKVDCQISLVTLDGQACVKTVRVYYKGHRSKKLRRKTVEPLDCLLPDLPIPIL